MKFLELPIIDGLLENVLGIGMATLTGVVSKVYKDYTIIRSGMKTIHFDRLTQIYNKHIETGYMSAREKEVYIRLYEVYMNLAKKDEYIENEKNQLLKLPIKK